MLLALYIYKNRKSVPMINYTSKEQQNTQYYNTKFLQS